MGECSAYSSLQSDSTVKFAAWPTSRRPPGTNFTQRTQSELSHMAHAIDDGTIKIVLGIIIIIIITTTTTRSSRSTGNNKFMNISN